MKRAWGIRHLRYYWHTFWFNRWWETQGRFLGAWPNPRDLAYLEAIWQGKA